MIEKPNVNEWFSIIDDAFALDEEQTSRVLADSALLALGDVPGHEFHGNQWTVGSGGRSHASGFPGIDLLEDAPEETLGSGSQSPSLADVKQATANVSFFHGTMNQALKSIKAEGLKPGGGKGADAWHKLEYGREFGSLIPGIGKNEAILADRKASVYLIQNEKYARYFSKYAEEVNPGSKAVVLKVEIPASEAARLKSDEGTPEPKYSGEHYGAFRFPGVIKPEWIKGRVLKTGKIKALAARDGTITIYVVLLVKEDNPRARADAALVGLGGPGSGNFGHAGRPGEVGGSDSSGGSAPIEIANAAPTLLDRRDGTGIDSLTQYTRPDGTLTPERQALHERIIEAQLAVQPNVSQEFPASGMTGGGGASGKTTLCCTTHLMGGGGASGKSALESELHFPSDAVKVDVDVIRTKLPEWEEELSRARAENRKPNEYLGSYTHEEASLISKKVIDRAIQRSNNLLVDGAGDSGIDKLTANVERYKAGGRDVVANYVTVDYDKAYARMRERGDQIGRYIPASHLKAVHADVSRTFPEAIKRGLFNEFTLWDTNNAVPLGNGHFSPPLKVASGRGKELTVHDQAAWERFLAKGNA